MRTRSRSEHRDSSMCPTRKNLRGALLVAVVALISFSCCQNANDERPTITVSIPPQSWLLSEIVGDKYNVNSLTQSTTNPENYEPGVNDMINLERSQAYMIIGRLPFEEVMITRAKEADSQIKIIDCSAGIEPLHGTHSHETHHHHDKPNHDDADPHIWTSVRNAVTIAGTMTQAVIELDPDNADEYLSNYATLKAKLEQLDNDIHYKLDTLNCRAFIVWHPSLSYFANDYNLRQISVEYEGKEAPVGQMRRVIDQAKDSGAQVFFYQQEMDSRQIYTINKEIGATMVTINPMSSDWENEMIKIADALTQQ